MIKIENAEVVGWEAAIRGMRNPMNSWDKSDSNYNFDWIDDSVSPHIYGHDDVVIGPNDHELAMRLRNAGTDHRKFMRMIEIYCDITAPQFWWAEFDTYKIGTVRNSCSKMHRIHVAPFSVGQFSREGCDRVPIAMEHLQITVNLLEALRQKFNETQNKDYWRAIIELLPSGYNMRATVMLSYEVLANMYRARQNHKLEEWREFCRWVEALPYAELIMGGEKNV